MRSKLRSLIAHIAAQWRWVVRTFIAWIVLGALAPAPPRAPLGEPQTVETEHPIVCAHTRLIDEVDEWKIQRSLQMVREMGATSIVEFFPWAYIETSNNHFDWGSTDRIVRQARNQGLHIIARTGLVPEWAREDVDAQFSTLNYLPEESYPEFAEFVAAFAERYAGVIDHVIIWNEPNLAFEWGYRQVDPAGYAALLRAVYAGAHAANPNVVILAAPLAPTLEPEGSPNGLNDLLYLDQLYDAGAAPYFDALAVHTYGFTEAPEAAPAFDLLNFRRAELLHDIMLEHNDRATPVYITETGWNDHPRWTKAVRPSLRAAYTVESFQYAEANWPWLERLCLWAFRYPADTFNYPDNFTLVTTDFQPKPIYYAVQAYARGWQQEGALWLPAPGE
jgi:polysaccharide biosynthesis protein PslG